MNSGFLTTIIMHKTRELLHVHIHNDLATIVLGYVQSVGRDWESVAGAGEYETCLEIPVNIINDGLYGACLGGHIELVNLMISRGADDWNNGLSGACRGGHIELVNLMISRGADDWNYGLSGACYGGHIELVNLMISRGANNCCRCNKSMIEHLQLEK